MKKILSVVACVGILLAGCGAGYVQKKNETFYTVVYENYGCYQIVYDNHTRVMYHISDGVNNSGTLTPLYNVDGTLRVWEE